LWKCQRGLTVREARFSSERKGEGRKAQLIGWDQARVAELIIMLRAGFLLIALSLAEAFSSGFLPHSGGRLIQPRMPQLCRRHHAVCQRGATALTMDIPQDAKFVGLLITIAGSVATASSAFSGRFTKLEVLLKESIESIERLEKSIERQEQAQKEAIERQEKAIARQEKAIERQEQAQKEAIERQERAIGGLSDKVDFLMVSQIVAGAVVVSGGGIFLLTKWADGKLVQTVAALPSFFSQP